jgi:hypothetical protein
MLPVNFVTLAASRSSSDDDASSSSLRRRNASMFRSSELFSDEDVGGGTVGPNDMGAWVS